MKHLMTCQLNKYDWKLKLEQQTRVNKKRTARKCKVVKNAADAGDLQFQAGFAIKIPFVRRVR